VILFDQETWHSTPLREQQHPVRYLKLAGKLAEANGIEIIETPYARNWATSMAEDVAAARYSTVVGIQSQRFDRKPLSFREHANRAIAAVRAANPAVAIMVGLASDAGGKPVSARAMLREYIAVYPQVAGFWLNAPDWPSPRGRGCATRGCPQVVRAFLNQIGVTA